MQKTSMKNILVVDDEADILLVLAEFLNKEGFHVLTANSGARAIEKLKEFQVDLILLDIAMPEMNGIETLKQMKTSGACPPVIMITAYKDAEKVVEAFRSGAYDCIFKPFDLKYLRESVLAKLLV